MRLVFDIEASGFYEEADTIWCIVTKDIDTGIIERYHKQDNPLYEKLKGLSAGLDALENADELIGHNIIDYDLRLLRKIYCYFTPQGLIFDTMLFSQLLQPDRAGGHSLASAGERQGRSKPEHEDWSRFTPEMLHRCSEDVEINTVLYHELIREAYEPIQGIPYKEIFK
jgi:DNA polymerase I-like protein with 3'-5' exonuclease and polymerase domains